MSRLKALALCCTISLTAHSANGQSVDVPTAAGCPCETDVFDLDGNPGVTNVSDIQIALDCAMGICEFCTSDCDVNCDSTVDYIDAGVVGCAVMGVPDCCSKPTGACTGAAHLPPCAVTLQVWCESGPEDGTYRGDGSFCNGDVAVAVPAVGGFGLLVIAASIIAAGAWIMRKRSAVAP